MGTNVADFKAARKEHKLFELPITKTRDSCVYKSTSQSKKGVHKVYSKLESIMRVMEKSNVDAFLA